MLASHYRLPAYRIPIVLKQGKRFRSDAYTFICEPSTESTSRFAVIVATRISKRATHRNRMKRLLHEAVSHRLSMLSLPVDGVFLISKDFSGATTREVTTWVNASFGNTQRAH